MEEIDTGELRGATVKSPMGERIGTVKKAYGDADSATWVSVSTGILDPDDAIIPLDDATIGEGEIAVPHDKDSIVAAPRLASDRVITPEEEERLRRHYGGGESNFSDEDFGNDRVDDTNRSTSTDSTGRERQKRK